jgi:hypothetical protein
MPDIQITPQMVEKWIGSDNLSVDHFLDLLSEIANGDYPVEIFRDEVLSYLSCLEEENQNA